MLMQLIVACPDCTRQYRAEHRSVGRRFHCHCGAVIDVRDPGSHDAAVVRCSNCGAPRRQQASTCSYCSSDFTLRDRDLNTICPSCFCRVSDRGRFCHHCGQALSPEGFIEKPTQLVCSACEQTSHLRSRKMGPSGVVAFECGTCAGMWMGQESFHLLTQHSRSKAAEPIIGTPRPEHRSPGHATGPQAAKTARHWKYRPCAECRALMLRYNYAKSGIVVDVCREHGVWFDASELPRILRWLRAGGARPSRSILRRGGAPKPVRRAAPSADHGGTARNDPWSAMARSAWQVLQDLLPGPLR